MVYVTDPIGDFLTRMRNAQSARQQRCSAPWSRLKEQLAELMKKEGWLADVSVDGEGVHKNIVVTFDKEKPALELTRISKPGRRVYSGNSDLKPVLNGFGIAILTTSQGLMTDVDARSKKVGGEVLCTIS